MSFNEPTFLDRLSSLHRIIAVVNGMFPDVKIVEDGPPADKPEGRWFVDFARQGHTVTVEITPDMPGFGVSSSDVPSGFGERPDEVLPLAPQMMARVLELLTSQQKTYVSLRTLRETQQMTQTQLAEKLGVQQPAVSKIERAEDPTYLSVRRFVEALGGTLEGVVVHIDGQRYIITPEKP
jgi:DNA-binding XRE family transcriptional regulator